MVLLHDQLQDARIWMELEPLVAAHATVLTVSTPPLRTLGSATAWADHIARYAREAISPDTVDLAVAIGGAGEAGIELVGDGAARGALLVDPDLTPFASESTRQLLGEPEAVDKLSAFFQNVDPHLEEFVSAGSLSEEGINALVDATFAGDEELPRHRRELLRQMMREQLRAMLPLDLAAQHDVLLDRPDWITRLVPLADKCAIAISPNQRWYAQFDPEATVRKRVPGVTVVRLTSSSLHLLSHPPEEVDAAIQDLLRAERGPAR